MNREEYEEKLAEQMLDRIKEEGCSSYNDYLNQRAYESAAREYERRLSNPYEY